MTSDWVLATEESGYSRHFDASALPVSIGGGADDDLALANAKGSVQIGLLDDIFFVQPTRGTENVRLDGELLRGSRRLADGNVVALDTARLTCRLTGGRLTLSIEATITAGDTAPPDFGALTEDEDQAGAITVDPIAFDPKQHGAGGRDGKRPGKAALGVYAAFVVLATLGWFAFTAKSVEFELEPRADSIQLPGTWFKFRLGERFLLRQGEHELVATRAGYYPIEQRVRVGATQDQTVALEFVRLPGLVSFETEPEAEAEVTVDGEVIGTTPLADIEVRPGEHQVQLRAERYLTEVRTLDVDGGHERQQLSVALTPSWATVSIPSSPAGATIKVDGRVQDETTPAELELTAGEREIALELEGYNTLSRTIQIVADEPLELPLAELEQADGRIAVETTPGGVSVSLNGDYLGRTPLERSLRPNVEYRLTLSRPGYETVEQTLTVAPGARRSLAIDLEPRIGLVDVTSEPAGAEVRVNGELEGVTPLNLELMAVEQSIEVRLQGYAPRAETITPRPGYPQTLELDLELLDTGTGGGYDRVVTTSLGQRLRLIPGGRQFQMGSSRSLRQRGLNEHLHPVEISRAFYLAEKEMTNAEFRQACDPNHASGSFEGQSLNEDEQPVVNVTYREIAECLNQLSLADGLQPVYSESGAWAPVRPLRNGYRLPTEAEWEYAARVAGRDEPIMFSWGDGDSPPDRNENLADLAARDILPNTLVSVRDGHAVSAPVGSFEPNAAGLYDMGGNVAEWVQDIYDPVATPSEEVTVDPLGPERGRLRVVRGPSWRSYQTRQLRLTYRDSQDDAREDIGFRIARNLE